MVEKKRNKTAKDLETEARVLAYIREYMHHEDIGSNEMARRLGTDSARMSRILNGAGFFVGFVLDVSGTIGVKLETLLKGTPAARWYEPGSELNNKNRQRSRGPRGSDTETPTLPRLVPPNAPASGPTMDGRKPPKHPPKDRR